MLKKIKPDAVLAFNAISEHFAITEASAPLGISVMVEKPLIINIKQSERINELESRYKINVLTNYETTWYPSNQEIFSSIHMEDKIGTIRKMVVHNGLKEIGVSKEFLSWLTI